MLYPGQEGSLLTEILVRERARLDPEPQQHGRADADHVVDAEPDDAAHGLRVEEHDDSCDTQTHRNLRVGQRSAEGIEALVLARCRPPGDLHSGDGQRASAVAALHGPVEEGSQAGGAVFGVLGVPGVDVDLAAGREGAVALTEPWQEGGSVLDLLGGEPPDAGCDVAPLGAGPQPKKDAPGREEPDRLDVLGIGDAGQVPGSRRWKEQRYLSTAGRTPHVIRSSSR